MFSLPTESLRFLLLAFSIESSFSVPENSSARLISLWKSAMASISWRLMDPQLKSLPKNPIDFKLSKSRLRPSSPASINCCGKLRKQDGEAKSPREEYVYFTCE